MPSHLSLSLILMRKSPYIADCEHCEHWCRFFPQKSWKNVYRSHHRNHKWQILWELVLPHRWTTWQIYWEIHNYPFDWLIDKMQIHVSHWQLNWSFFISDSKMCRNVLPCQQIKNCLSSLYQMISTAAFATTFAQQKSCVVALRITRRLQYC